MTPPMTKARRRLLSRLSRPLVLVVVVVSCPQGDIAVSSSAAQASPRA